MDRDTHVQLWSRQSTNELIQMPLRLSRQYLANVSQALVLLASSGFHLGTST